MSLGMDVYARNPTAYLANMMGKAVVLPKDVSLASFCLRDLFNISAEDAIIHKESWKEIETGRRAVGNLLESIFAVKIPLLTFVLKSNMLFA